MSELVVKDNALIEASYTLGLAEQRLILLAIIEARETGEGIDSNSVLNVHAHSYAEQFGIDKNNAYAVIKDASKGLFDRYVTYHDKNPKNGNDRSFHCRWVDKIGYEPKTGTVYLRFTPDVVPLITRLEEQFTSYEIEQVAQLDSGYAIRLYELLIKWRSTRKTPVFELSQFRQQLGVEENQYKTMSNFKSRVLEPSIKQINKHTDIKAKYEQHKSGRTITGFSFTFSFKNTKPKTISNDKKQDNDNKQFTPMTTGQLATFSAKLAQHHNFSNNVFPARTGEDMKAYTFRVQQALSKYENQKKWIKHMESVGFAPRYK